MWGHKSMDNNFSIFKAKWRTNKGLEVQMRRLDEVLDMGLSEESKITPRLHTACESLTWTSQISKQRSEKKEICGQLAGFLFCHCLIWEKWRPSTHSFRSWILVIKADVDSNISIECHTLWSTSVTVVCDVN